MRRCLSAHALDEAVRAVGGSGVGGNATLRHRVRRSPHPDSSPQGSSAHSPARAEHHPITETTLPAWVQALPLALVFAVFFIVPLR